MRLQYTFYFNGKANIKVEELLEVAANQDEMLMENGSWKAAESTDDQFVALTVEVAALKKLNATYKSKTAGNKSTGEGNTSVPWKSVAPTKGPPQKKTVGSKTFIWCPHHKYWGCHEPSTCFKIKRGATEPPNEMSPAQNEAVLQMTAIMARLMGNSEYDGGLWVIGHTTVLYYRPLPKGVPWCQVALASVHILALADPAHCHALVNSRIHEGQTGHYNALDLLHGSQDLQSWLVMPSKHYITSP